MAIFFNFSLTQNHLHPLQVENCDSNSRLVVDEDDNGKFRPERVKQLNAESYTSYVSLRVSQSKYIQRQIYQTYLLLWKL